MGSFLKPRGIWQGVYRYLLQPRITKHIVQHPLFLQRATRSFHQGIQRTLQTVSWMWRSPRCRPRSHSHNFKTAGSKGLRECPIIFTNASSKTRKQSLYTVHLCTELPQIMLQRGLSWRRRQTISVWAKNYYKLRCRVTLPGNGKRECSTFLPDMLLSKNPQRKR